MPKITFKRVLIITAALAGFAIILNVLTESMSVSSDEYISKDSGAIKYSDVKEYLSKVDFSSKNSTELFKGGVVNKYTLKFFKYLQTRYKDLDYDAHIEAVKNYLYSAMDSAEADKLLELYKKYIEYEKVMAAELNSAGELKSTDDYLNILKKMKALQVELFGKENAEILFGTMMKAQEYPVRRGGIINDNTLYAAEKEKRLQKLNADMWGDEGSMIESSRKPYVAYTETLSLYSKDFSEMSDSMKQQKISEIRKNIFPPDVVERLEDVDRNLESDKKRDEQYQKDYSNIMNNTELSGDEKNSQVKALQDKVYGEEADSVRRMEDMSKGKDDLKKKYNLN